MDKIRIMIVDDHEVVRLGLGRLIGEFEDMELVAQADDGAQAVALVAEAQPDVILMDMVMPNVNGVEATRAILAAHPEVRIVALTGTPDEDYVRDAIAAGAMGYLLKTVTLPELAAAVRRAFLGEATLSPAAQQALINTIKRSEGAARFHLSERELEVLALLVKGLNNPDIAERLVVSRATVKFHVSSIFAKLGVSSRAEAVAVALENRLLSQT